MLKSKAARGTALRSTSVLERLTEIAVIISLFTAGLKLRLPASDQRWRAPILLAALAMVLTIGGIAAFAMAALGLSIGAAVLLGALLAPTDPVLASDVQVSPEHDAEPVRFSLTGESGLNDGTAFPFVMLGLGLMRTHGIGAYGWRWLTVDLVWAVAAGFGVGTLCGAGIGKLVLYWRRVHREAVGACIAWFGVRGVGSIYYLADALSQGVPAPAGRMLADVTLVVVAGSIVLHGISVTPLMQRYSAFTARERQGR